MSGIIKTKMLKKVCVTILIAMFLLPTMSVEARFFDANNIITDKELTNSDSLSRTAIQQFLEAKNSVLARTTDIVNGIPKLVSEVIYEVGKQYNISQKFLLAKLQQEQGLIERSTATTNAIDWATGFSCFNNRCNEEYRGIAKQITAAAAVQRIYIERMLNSPNYFGFSVGRESKTSDNFLVVPENLATANLYIYTPYRGGPTGIGGNYAFWRVWNRYFTERPYPEGTFLRNSISGEYYKVEGNKLRKFANSSVYLADYSPNQAIEATPERISYYSFGEPILFSNNTIVRGSASGITYLISDGSRHRVVGEKALASLGNSLGFVIASSNQISPIILSDQAISSYPEGEPITENSIYPLGELLRDETGSIFFVKHGIKHPIFDESVWRFNFGSKEPIHVATATLSSYTTGDPVGLVDGSVVKSNDGKFFVISEGRKHQITFGEIIRRTWGEQFYLSAPVASVATLALHPTSDTIDYIDDSVSDPANYISYAERTGSALPPSGSPVYNPSSYLAVFDTVGVPDSVLAGSSSNASVKFRNRGTAVWEAGKVFLKLIDENNPTSSFLADNRIPLASNVSENQIAEFNFNITAPLSGGTITEWFILEYQSSDGRILEMPGGLVSKNISVSSGVSAQIISHNIPVAVRNKWGPINISIKLKNTSTEQIWLSRRAAFKLVGGDGKDSPFYDRNDWIDKLVVGVPMNRTRVAPGEEGIVNFTLNPKGLAPGVYELVFSMNLRDVEKEVFLNGQQTWSRLIRVDQ